MTKSPAHRWVFAARFRRRGFGWRSAPAAQRVKEAVSEISAIARSDPALAAEGAVRFLEKVSPALEQVDSSSGAIGSAVNRAIDALVPLIAAAPVTAKARDRWLDRQWGFRALAAQERVDEAIAYAEASREKGPGRRLRLRYQLA